MKCQKCDKENPDYALYCGYCGARREPLKKSEPAAPQEENRTNSGLLKLIVLLVLAAAGYFAQKHFGQASGANSAAPETTAISDRMRLAEKFLEEHQQARSAFLADLEEGYLDSDGFGPNGRYFKKYKKLEDDELARFNALKLPCPQTDEARNEPGYVEWSLNYKKKETELTDKFNGKYERLVVKAILNKK
jgi:hypothetical protein